MLGRRLRRIDRNQFAAFARIGNLVTTFSNVRENEMEHKVNKVNKVGKESKEIAAACPCPECGEQIALSTAERVIGNRVRCLHCNAEALVEQEFDPKTGKHHWTLESPDDEVPTEPR